MAIRERIESAWIQCTALHASGDSPRLSKLACEQMIPDLASLLGFRGRPGGWQGREAGPGRALDIDEARRGASHPPFSSRSAARVRNSESKGGSRKTMSKGRPAPPRKRNASPCSTSAPLAPHSESLARNSRTAAASPLDEGDVGRAPRKGLEPEAPLPAKMIVNSARRVGESQAS